MAKDFETRCLYEFKGFRLDGIRRLLSKDKVPLPLAPKALETLLVLVENSGRLVEKTELINRVWPDSFVEEINLTVHISALRKILGETPDEHHYIVTVPRRGYMFVAPVTEIPDESLSDPSVTSVNFSEPTDVIPNNQSNSDPMYESLDLADIAYPQTDGEAAVPKPEPVKRSHWRLTVAIAITIAAVGFTLAAVYFFNSRKTEPISLKGKSIAVLPFKSLSSNGEETFELGLADALITKLTRLKRINVKPTSAIFIYADRSTDPIVAGRQLGVDTVVQGTVQKVGEQVRLTVQMIRVEDGKPVWANHFDAQGTDFFALQDSLSEQVLQEINQQLLSSE